MPNKANSCPTVRKSRHKYMSHFYFHNILFQNLSTLPPPGLASQHNHGKQYFQQLLSSLLIIIHNSQSLLDEYFYSDTNISQYEFNIFHSFLSNSHSKSICNFNIFDTFISLVAFSTCHFRRYKF